MSWLNKNMHVICKCPRTLAPQWTWKFIQNNSGHEPRQRSAHLSQPCDVPPLFSPISLSIFCAMLPQYGQHSQYILYWRFCSWDTKHACCSLENYSTQMRQTSARSMPQKWVWYWDQYPMTLMPKSIGTHQCGRIPQKILQDCHSSVPPRVQCRCAQWHLSQESPYKPQSNGTSKTYEHMRTQSAGARPNVPVPVAHRSVCETAQMLIRTSHNVLPCRTCHMVASLAFNRKIQPVNVVLLPAPHNTPDT